MKLRTVESVADIPADQWNACANPSGFNPFVSHEFFKALEDSGSATAETGWKAEHLVYETAKGEIAGIAPCYVKPHSQGEYVFDHGWAEALPPGRRALLSQTAVIGSLHAGDRPAAVFGER